jgi:hypothetical protein
MKSRIILPLLALLFGIAGAFASVDDKTVTTPDRYNDTRNCVSCTAIDLANNCQEIMPEHGIRCQCQVFENGSFVQKNAQNNETCALLWKIVI